MEKQQIESRRLNSRVGSARVASARGKQTAESSGDYSITSRSHQNIQQAVKTGRDARHKKKRVKCNIKAYTAQDDEIKPEEFENLSVDMINSMVDQITGVNTEQHMPVEMKLKARVRSERHLL